MRMVLVALTVLAAACDLYEDHPPNETDAGGLPACTCEVGFCDTDGVCRCPDEDGVGQLCQRVDIDAGAIALPPSEPPPTPCVPSC